MLDTAKILQQSVSRLLESRPDVSRLDLSRLMDVSDGALGRIKYGTGNPTAETLERIARFFRVEPWQLLVPGFDLRNPPQLAQDNTVLPSDGQPRPGYVRFKLLDVRPSAGPGALMDEPPEVLEELDVLESWARQNFGNPDPGRIVITICKGDSMAPTIQSGDVMFVDTLRKHFDGDGIYVLNWQGRLLVKRLRLVSDGRLAIQSDNTVAYPAEYVSAATVDQLAISGMVAAWWTLKRY